MVFFSLCEGFELESSLRADFEFSDWSAVTGLDVSFFN